jgi:PAS domain S-box-containing protein
MEQLGSALPLRILDNLPNPVLIKDQSLKFVWINQAFETLFAVSRESLIGRLDREVFPDRQVAQCNGGDLRVLETGDVDQAVETVFDEHGCARETITRKSRLILDNDDTFLVGVMHDITEVTRANEALEANRVRLEEQAIELARLATTDALTGCSM